MKRAPTEAENLAIRRVAERLPDDRGRQLLDDLRNALAESAAQDGSRVVFEIAGYKRPPYHGQHSFGIEGELRDRDEAMISFDLYADENGRLLELELIRWDGEDLIDPIWTTLRVY